jgi:hypothetical protein
MKRIVGALGAAAALVLAVPHAATAGVDTVGWFTRNPTASAPDGGLQVANAPDGIVSYGAISVTEEGDTITRATLTLKEEGQGLNAAGATLRACPAAGSFKAGQGALADGPKADCAIGSAELTRDGEGVWTGDVTSVLSGDAPALAVVPAEGAGVFQVSFAPPDLAVEADASSGSSSLDSFDASEFGGSSGGGSSSSSSSSSSFDDFSSSSGSGSSFSGGSSGSFDSTAGGSTFDASSFAAAPATPPVPAEGAAAVDAAAEPELAGGTAMPTRRRVAGTAASATTSGNTGAQFFFFVLAAAVIGTGAGIGRNRLVTARGA